MKRPRLPITFRSPTIVSPRISGVRRIVQPVFPMNTNGDFTVPQAPLSELWLAVSRESERPEFCAPKTGEAHRAAARTAAPIFVWIDVFMLRVSKAVGGSHSGGWMKGISVGMRGG